MDQRALLHKMSVETNVNTEMLADLIRNPKLLAWVKAGKATEAILLIRAVHPRMGLWECKRIVELLSQETR